MNSNRGTRLQKASEKYVARSRKNTAIGEDVALSLVDHTSDRGQSMKRRVRVVHEQRISRVEMLRAQVRAGTYAVKPRVLAERMLENETHFLENTQE